MPPELNKITFDNLPPISKKKAFQILSKKIDELDKKKDIAIVLIHGKFFTQQYHWVVYPIDKVKTFWGKDTVIDLIYLIKKKDTS